MIVQSPFITITHNWQVFLVLLIILVVVMAWPAKKHETPAAPTKTIKQQVDNYFDQPTASPDDDWLNRSH